MPRTATLERPSSLRLLGVGLILGLLTRFSATMGTLMMLFFFLAAWDFAFGIVNQHLTYALVTAFLGYIGAGNYMGLDRTVGENVSPGFRRWFLSGDPERGEADRGYQVA